MSVHSVSRATLRPAMARRLALFCRSASTAASPLPPSTATTPASPASSRTPTKTTAAASTTKSTFKRLPTTARTASSTSGTRPYSRTAAAAKTTPPPPNAGAADAATTTTAAAADDVDAIIPEAPAASSSAVTGPPVDWSSSFHGLSTTAFSPEVATVLMAPIDVGDIEIKPDGIIYLPEIKYRRILNLAFGPGGWGLAPRGELAVGEKIVSREYALVVQGRFVGQARGECGYFGGDDGVATAGEGCKSNALMRCCKDLGVASELWDPRFIRQFKQQHCREVWVEHVATKKRRQIWLRNDCPPVYPYVAASGTVKR